MTLPYSLRWRGCKSTPGATKTPKPAPRTPSCSNPTTPWRTSCALGHWTSKAITWLPNRPSSAPSNSTPTTPWRTLSTSKSSSNYEEAIREYEAAIAINPNLADLHLALGRNYRVLDIYDKAVEEFTRADALNPGDPTPDLYISRTYATLGQYAAYA